MKRARVPGGSPAGSTGSHPRHPFQPARRSSRVVSAKSLVVLSGDVTAAREIDGSSRFRQLVWPWERFGSAFLCTALLLGLIERLAIITYPIHTLFATGFLVDDAFYYASFAREFAAGNLLQIAPDQVSNGIQPLFLLLIAPAWWLSDPAAEETVRFGLVLSSLASVATALAIALWARRLGAGASALGAGALWAVGPMSIVFSLNGMETALAIALLTAIGAYWPLLRSRPLGLGLLFGVSVLARFDSLLLAPVLALIAARHWVKTDGVGNAMPRAIRALVGFCVATLPAAWVSWNLTGHVMPQSAAAIRTLTALPDATPELFFALPAVVDHARIALVSISTQLLQQIVGLPIPPGKLPRLIPFGLLFILLLPLVLWQARLRPRRAARPLAIGAALIALWIAAYAAWAGGHWAYGRYFHGALVLITLVLATGLDLDRLAARRWGRVLAFVLLLLFAGISMGKLHGALSKPRWSAEQDARLLRFVERRIDAGERVGMFQSGRLGYLTRGEVVNLDGVVNPAAARALAEGTLDGYLRSQRIDVIVDEPKVLGPLLLRTPRAGPLRLEPIGAGVFVAYRVRVASGS